MTTATKSKKKKITRADIISHYMNLVLEHESHPISVYKFCKGLKISEKEFYDEFGSLDSLKKQIWIEFLNQTKQLLGQSDEYANYGKKEKLLTLYFTLFELLTLNRSYILLALQEAKLIVNSSSDLNGFKKEFKLHISDLANFAPNEESKIKQVSSKALEEIAWGQFLLILKFWMTDDSPGFEKTDVLIEKTVNSAFELVDIKPVAGVIDLAKFLIKERWGK